MKKIVFLAIYISNIVAAQQTLIENITIVDVENGRVQKAKNVLIKNGLIDKITAKTISKTSEITVIDGTSKFLMPGMMDAHIHFFQTGSLYTRPDAIDLQKIRSYDDEIKFADSLVQDSFNRYLALGITSVMDMGGPFWNFRVRDTLAKRSVAPNILVTGPLFSPYQPDAFSTLDDFPIAEISTKEEATALFEKMLPYNPDYIKIWYVASKELPAEKTYPVVAHISKLAHDNNLKLTVHATDLNTAKLAVRAGADILVHSVRDTLIDQNFIKDLKRNNITYIPTLMVSKNYGRTFLGEPSNHSQDLSYGNSQVYRTLTDMQGLDSTQIPSFIPQFKKTRDTYFTRLEKRDSIMYANLEQLAESKVNIATGTDAGNIGTLHASSYLQELELMKKAGLTNAEILKASTFNVAKGFGMSDTYGTVKEGKIADLIILNENPLENLNTVSKPDVVFRNGNLLNPDELLKESPENLVQRQVNAYNAQDIDQFMNTYADDIKIYDFPNTLRLEGKEKLRETFDKMFKKVTNLYCKIENRSVLGNKVVDREHVRFGDKYSDVIAVYEIENGKIAKVTFIR